VHQIEMVPGVHWVGTLDPQLRVFDVIMKAEHGTTYNSYLIKGSDGCALVETSKGKFTEQYIKGLTALIDPSDIDYIVLNHMEPDHTGALSTLLELAMPVKIVTSRNAVPFITNLLNREVEITTVGDGDTIDLGDMTLEFFQAPFLHWPETMFTFLREKGILFPCDFMGSHYADERMFDDKVDDFEFAFKYYFDHIFRPFKEFVNKALDKIEGLPIQLIAPSHGPILRTDIYKYVEKYRKWASLPEKSENPRVIIFYTSAYGNTGKMAHMVGEGARAAGADAVVFDLEDIEILSMIDEVEKADAIAVGSLTINGDAVKPVWELLSSLATIKLKGKSAVAFGSYGWSGEAVRLIEERLKGLKFKIPAPGLRVQLVPTEDDLDACRSLGKDLVESVK